MKRFELSRSAESLQPSGIRKFFDLAAGMKGVISLGVGEPDFITPWNVRQACIRSLEEGYTAYTANAGLLELRQEIAKYLQKQFHVSYDPNEEIIVTVGASQALDVAMRAIVNPDDEVIIIEPSFVSYAPLVTLAGGVPVPVATSLESAFKVQPEQIEAAITTKTKAILLCSPNNPTGALLNRSELEKLAVIVEKYNLIVLSDEIYAELVYDEAYTSFASIQNMRDHTILISGFSKGFAMTGWRLGMIAAPVHFSELMLKIHQYSMMCAPTMSQFAALEALRSGNDEVIRMRESYKKRRNFMTTSFNEMGLTCHMPGGAFYVFPSISSTGLSSAEFAEQLLLEEKVAVVPGSVFGESGEGFIRCSYATSLEQLMEAMKRMERFMENKKRTKQNTFCP
ncbi:aromatic amino acid aminotransferase [Bacillus pseudomycoides]|uniref:Aminotransferase n=1 Tax=Bacillus pseudomycoides TaxID=64104 RepID=A0AA91VBK5_9BACI|nr:MULTISPECIES: aminotransferase [Bacillus]PEB50544.1 aromatic amino acid aminotransferase [Bacillus sp. AFS098217]PED81996.1 aromatic amino acid aminotransferase [Bacillus pseudomycoides]PEU05660.1 aromatic amino acid aminotransferase [Bacillus sp. AFS019443]PEU10507.1 aromatic amino acid aminotransferase [Bacillus sp. AFS014408]PFW61141.1 aromatic amino acid aminotransferase [Bacillus sp. AFS075034]